MRRLRYFLAGRRASGERGAVLVLTAFLTMFVAIGLLALTVDLGNITYNRAQLQNGSDAASLALAAACAQPSAAGASCGVSPSLTTLAAQNANVSNQSMTILTDNRTCIGRGPFTGVTTLPPCPTSPRTANPASLSSCQPWPLSVDPSKVSYVEVTTETAMSGGGSILPYYFGQLLGGGIKGSTQWTCSRAAWGAAGSTGATLPVTMGQCDWSNATVNGTKYAPAPAPEYTDPAPNTGSNPPKEVWDPANNINYVTGIFLHDSKSTQTCAASPNGGFNWLAPDDSTACNVTISSTDPAAPGSPGNAPSCDIAKYLNKVVSIPIFSSFNLSGNNATYQIIGVAAFYLAGYTNITGSIGTKSVYNQPPTVCPTTNAKCKTGSLNYLWGWFVSSLLPVSSATIDPNGQSMGANVLVPAG